MLKKLKFYFCGSCGVKGQGYLERYWGVIPEGWEFALEKVRTEEGHHWPPICTKCISEGFPVKLT